MNFSSLLTVYCFIFFLSLKKELLSRQREMENGGYEIPENANERMQFPLVSVSVLLNLDSSQLFYFYFLDL